MTGIGTGVRLPKSRPLDERTTRELIRRAHEGDDSARSALVEANLRLAYSIALRLSRPGYEVEDLYQIGCIGLVKAVDRFDLSYDVRFSTYAVPIIAGEIKRYLRDDGLLKVSRSVKRTGRDIMAAKERLTAEYGREPTLKEVADCLSLSVEDVVAALDAVRPISSLNERLTNTDDDSAEVQDVVATDRDDYDSLINSVSLRNCIESLPERDRKILMLRYFEHMTQTEVANEFGVSQVQISRIEKKLLLLLRERMLS